ncbi:MAG: hypothetical protein ACI8PZ_000493 [Myxococcota bacterium]
MATYKSGGVWFRNGGGLAFDAGVGLAPDIWLGFGFGRAEPVDLDGDGDVDVLLAEAWTDRLHVVENLGGGTFAAPVEVPDVLDGLLTGAWATSADLDGDGDPDVIVASDNYYYGNGHVAVLGNDGGVLGRPGVLGTRANSVHVADLDGDGDPDVFSSGSGPGTTVAWFNEGDGSGPACPWRPARPTRRPPPRRMWTATAMPTWCAQRGRR